MHKLHEAVTCKINEIVCSGINIKNLAALGALVDIRKDIEQMWHWRHEDAYAEEAEGNRELTVHELIGNIMSLDAKLKSADSPEAMHELKKHIHTLYENAETIKRAYESVKMDADLAAKFKALYK